MPRTPADDVHPILPGCEPWSSPGGGPHGALVLHGFTGSPVSMRPLAEALADAGFAVDLPRLPGHGTSVEDLAETSWDDWLTEADRALRALRERTPDGEVVVVGLSMGGALTAALAEGHPEITGIVLINTPVAAPAELASSLEEMLAGGVDIIDSIGGDIADPDADEVSYDATPLRPLLTMLTAGEQVRERLSDIFQPTLLITSRQDHVVNPGDSDVLAAGISGPVERLWLEKSFHVATLDYDAAELEAATVDFTQRVTGASAGQR
ncbi:MAG: alpha/beta hydrolase [Acidimicrobiales bacterium]